MKKPFVSANDSSVATLSRMASSVKDIWRKSFPSIDTYILSGRIEPARLRAAKMAATPGTAKLHELLHDAGKASARWQGFLEPRAKRSAELEQQVVRMLEKWNGFSRGQTSQNCRFGIENNHPDVTVSHGDEPSSGRMAIMKPVDVLALSNLQSSLEESASKGIDFKEEDIEAMRAWTAANADVARHLVRTDNLHGRIRWLLLEILAKNPTAQLRNMLVDLLDVRDDLWLLAGVLTVLRSAATPEYAGVLRDKLRAHLPEVLQPSDDYRDRLGNSWHTVVGLTAVSEMLMLFGSIAEAADIPLLAEFVLGDRPRKPRNNAFNALARTICRHTTSPETEAFFVTHGDRLQLLADVWANSQRSSRDLGVLLLCWIELVVARLGPEAEWAVVLAERMPAETRSVRVRLKDAHQALEKRKRHEWLDSRAGAYQTWLERLESLVPERRPARASA